MGARGSTQTNVGRIDQHHRAVVCPYPRASRRGAAAALNQSVRRPRTPEDRGGAAGARRARRVVRHLLLHRPRHLPAVPARGTRDWLEPAAARDRRVAGVRHAPPPMHFSGALGPLRPRKRSSASSQILQTHLLSRMRTEPWRTPAPVFGKDAAGRVERAVRVAERRGHAEADAMFGKSCTSPAGQPGPGRVAITTQNFEVVPLAPATALQNRRRNAVAPLEPLDR